MAFSKSQIFHVLAIIFLSIYVGLVPAEDEYFDETLSLNCADSKTWVAEHFLYNCSANQGDECEVKTDDSLFIPDPRWNKFVLATCFCDELCPIYGDCCESYVGKQTLVESDSMFISRESFQCKFVNPILQFKVALYLINKCPRSWEEDSIRLYCENEHSNDLFLNWPVSDSRELLYKNVYCAICNGRQEPDLTYWESTIECYDPREEGNLTEADFYRLLREKVTDGKCNIRYSMPEAGGRLGFRPCKMNVDSCPDSWSDECILSKCQSEPHSYVYGADNGITYKNKYCAICNGVRETSCIDAISRSNIPLLNHLIFPLSIVLDLNKGSGSVRDYVGHEESRHQTDIALCPTGQIYDPYLDVCRAVVCRTGYNFINGNCLAKNNNVTLTDCHMKLLDSDEFTLLSDGFLLDNNTWIVIQSRDFELLPNGSALVCLDFGNKKVQLKFSRVQTILSAVGQIISIFGLGLHFVVYMSFPQLRNLAGKNLICLVVSLFCAQLLFLVGVGRTGNYGTCATIGVLIHFLFLASFSWMHVMSYDIWHTFSRSTAPPSAADNKTQFKRYSVYGWGLPSTLVTIAVIVNFSAGEDNLFRPAYGEFICWIGFRNALALFFAVPVAIIVLSNIIFYALTVINIHSVSQTAIFANKNSAEATRLGLYIKLSVIMGLTWVFGFIAAVTDSQTLWYLFIITGTLQGAFICVAFVFTKRVYTLIREKLKAGPQKKRDGQTTSKSDQTQSTTVSRNSNQV